MFEFKLNMFYIFLILLFVLILSVILGKKLTATNNYENFIGFYGNHKYLDNVVIPNYSNPLVKLYDDKFYDVKNGNVVEILGDPLDTTATTTSPIEDLSGSSIKTINIVSRDGTTKTYTDISTNISESNLQNVSNSFVSWDIHTAVPKQPNSSNNQLFYIPWGTDTYMHIIDTTTNNNIQSYLFSVSGNPLSIPFTQNASININQPTVLDYDANNSKIITDNSLNLQLYQLSHSVKFNFNNGYLYIQKSDGVYDIYDRSGSLLNTQPQPITSIKDVSYNSFLITDTIGNSLVLFMPNGKKTLVVVIQKDANGYYKIFNLARFGETGVETSGGIQSYPSQPAKKPDNIPVGGEDKSDYYKWYWYWNLVGGKNNVPLSQDYILKTQVVPPVCPACPSCSGTACTNCGGVGGSGTLNPQGGTMVYDGKTNYTDFLSQAGGSAVGLAKNTVGGAVGLAKDTVSGVVGLAKETVGGAVGLAKETVGGAVGLAKDTVGGTVGLAKNAVGGAVGLAENTVGGAVGLAENTVGGAVGTVKGLFSTNPANITQTQTSSGTIPGQPVVNTQQSQYQSQNMGVGVSGAVSTGPQNPYTYNGAISEKPTSNFMPVTADFSKFGR